MRPPQTLRSRLRACSAAHFRCCLSRILALLLAILPVTVEALNTDQHRADVSEIVARIQRADYEGDRAALKRLYARLAIFREDEATAAKVHYWRGFALWRRALNGFNEAVGHNEQDLDLKLALEEFEEAARRSPAFVDAWVGAASCLQNLAFLHFSKKDIAHSRELLEASLPLLANAEAVQPENPRLLWVLGAYRWYSPPERGGGQTTAIRTYEHGLRAARSSKTAPSDGLTPSWGEPELLMNMAFAQLHRSEPDLAAAEKHARSALQLVPYWHYVRDILLPQIQQAQDKAKKSIPTSEKRGVVLDSALLPLSE